MSLFALPAALAAPTDAPSEPPTANPGGDSTCNAALLRNEQELRRGSLGLRAKLALRTPAHVCAPYRAAQASSMMSCFRNVAKYQQKFVYSNERLAFAVP